MPRRTQPDAVDRDGLPTTDHMDRLCAAYERIADDITAIRKAIERLYDDLGWALRTADTLHDLPGLLAHAREPDDSSAAHLDPRPANATNPVMPAPGAVPPAAAHQPHLF